MILGPDPQINKFGERGLWEFFVNVFPMGYLHDQNNQFAIMNFIDNMIVARTNFLKKIVAFHLGRGGNSLVHCPMPSILNSHKDRVIKMSC